MTIVDGRAAISRQPMIRAMQKVRELTPRGTQFSLEQAMNRINEWYIGWSGYYLMTHFTNRYNRRAHKEKLRASIVDQQKRRRHLYKKLVKRGVPRDHAAKTVQSNPGRWALSWTKALHMAYPNRWISDVLGQRLKSNAMLKHWLGVRRWIRVT